MGGFDAAETILDSVVELDVARGDAWVAVRHMLAPRLACAAAVHDGRLYVAGGYNHADSHLRRCVQTCMRGRGLAGGGRANGENTVCILSLYTHASMITNRKCWYKP